ncbi:MAG: 50S ribosomal protein L7/L12 [Chloroflexi bacterium]|nr:50S ribosomal protein L7/L12 [Chloroflexota bacterium]
MDKDEVMKVIKEMSVVDLAELVKALEEEFGVSAAAPVAIAAAPGAAGAVAATPEAVAAEEQTEFTVLIKEIGANKINVIKAVREVTSLGLREAKELVEGAPTTVKDSITKDEAAEIQKKLEDAGASVAIE